MREVSERHRHRYEVNNAYRDRLIAAGLRGQRDARRTVRWSSSSSCPPTSTRSSSAPRRTRSSRAGRPARTRCSRRSSARRSTTARRTGCRSSCTASGRRSVRVQGPSEHVLGRPGRSPRPATTSPSSPPTTSTPARCSRCAATTCRMPGGGTSVREIMEHAGAVAVAALDARRPADDDLPVPARARAAPLGDAGGPAGRRRARTRWRRPGASWPRRSVSRRTSGPC